MAKPAGASGHFLPASRIARSRPAVIRRARGGGIGTGPGEAAKTTGAGAVGVGAGAAAATATPVGGAARIPLGLGPVAANWVWTERRLARQSGRSDIAAHRRLGDLDALVLDDPDADRGGAGSLEPEQLRGASRQVDDPIAGERAAIVDANLAAHGRSAGWSPRRRSAAARSYAPR